MTQAQLLRDLDEYIIWFSFLLSVLFTPVATLMWRWWKHPWGVNIVTLELAIAFALLPAWLSVAFGLRHAAVYVFAWVQLASVALVGVVIISRLLLIWKTQRRVAVPPGEAVPPPRERNPAC